MEIYKNAAELLLKRLYGIYGVEKTNLLAKSCSLEADSSGNIVSGITDEEQVLRCLWEKIKSEFGPIAIIGSRVTLMGFFLHARKELPKWIK